MSIVGNTATFGEKTNWILSMPSKPTPRCIKTSRDCADSRRRCQGQYLTYSEPRRRAANPLRNSSGRRALSFDTSVAAGIPSSTAKMACSPYHLQQTKERECVICPCLVGANLGHSQAGPCWGQLSHQVYCGGTGLD